MRAATLFSGIGAPECARPDWQWLWHAEIEPFPAAVMQARHPGSVNLGNVLADDFAERAERAGRPDVLVFGSPCQSFSVAGKRLGLSDPRGNLALVALRIIERLKPQYFVFENVPGLVSSDNGNDLRIFCDTVTDIGYYMDIDILDAQHFGLAQRRERVFAICENADIGRQKRTHSFVAASLNSLIEMSLAVLAGLIGPYERDALALEPIGPYSADGLNKKMQLFRLPLPKHEGDQEATAVWQSWLSVLDEALATCPNGRGSSTSASARRSGGPANIAAGRWLDTETEASCLSMWPLWSDYLDALSMTANKSTISTATKATTHRAIYTSSLVVLRICERIIRSTPLPESYWLAALSSLTALKVFTAYARQTNSDLFESMHCGDDWFSYIPRSDSTVKELERCLGDGKHPNPLFSLAEGLRGYPEKGREARQRTSPSVIKGAAIGRQPENGPQRGDTLSDGTCFTLNCTEVHAVAHALRAEGFDASEDGTGRGTPLVPVAYGGNNTAGPIDVATALNAHGGPHGRCDFESETFVAQAMNLRGREGGAMPEMADVASLRAASGGSSRSYVAAVHENQRAELTTSDTVGALKSGGGKPGQGYPAVLTQSLQPSTNGGINQRTSTEPADADASETDAGKVLRDLRQSIGAKAFSEWGIGVLASFREAEVLLRAVLCDLLAQGEVGRELVVGAHDVAEQGSARTMREMRSAGRARRSPPQPRSSGQSARELGAYLSELPQQGAPPASLLHDLRRASEGSRLLQQALDTLEEVRRPDGWEDRHEEALRDRGLSGSQPRSRTMQPPCAASETGHALQVRRLTVIECCRLQGFPDLHLMIDRHPNGRRIDAETANYLASHGVKVWQRDEKHGIRWYTAAPADGPMYRAAGNSMAVPVLRWLLTRIEAFEQARSLAA